ncbi:Hsp70 family protein [Myxococcota bacterium]|nr:Hsp70 family protein [Myxococcota bacterium]
MSTIFGIDLGTTFCACARVSPPDTSTELIKLERNGSKSGWTMPSKVFITEDFRSNPRAIVGSQAILESISKDEGELVEFAKRHIGLTGDQIRRWTDLDLDPTDISSLILRKIKKAVDESDQSRPLVKAVVTHPRDFTIPRKEATAQAVALAGIELIDTINEPEAALYGYFKPGENEADPGIYLIFDLGGGTLDIAILEVPEEGQPQVIGGHGQSELGGKDWDDVMFKHIMRSAETHHAQDEFDYRADISQLTYHQLKDLACQFKETSAGKEIKKKVIKTVLRDKNEVMTVIKVQVKDWERECQPLIERCSETIDQALEDAGVSIDAVTRVLPVGGSVRLRAIQNLLYERFGEDRVAPITGRDAVDVDAVVAEGAARFGAIKVAQDLAQNSPNQAIRAMMSEVVESAPRSSLAHGINVLVWRHEGEYLSPLVEKGIPVPIQKERFFQVNNVNDHLIVEIFEGPEGPRPDGASPSKSITFPPSIGARVGDRVRMVVNVSDSGRITVSAHHERSQGSQSIELQPRGNTSSEINTDLERKARLNRIEVI